MKPITSPPEKILTGGWNRRAGQQYNWLGFYQEFLPQNKNTTSSDIYKYVGDNDKGKISYPYHSIKYHGYHQRDRNVKFVNDKTIILQRPGTVPSIYDKVPLRKTPASTKPSSSSSGVSKNVKLYYDWLVRREFGDPGPVPKASNFDRQRAVNMFILRTGGRPSPEINYGR